MPLEVYHLQLSQSDRVVWLLEEMGIPYNLHVYKRNPESGLAPEELKAINPFGTAPYFKDTSLKPEVALSETGAIVAYILESFPSSPDGTRMIRKPGDADYTTYLQWFHFGNGSMQPSVSRNMSFVLAGLGNNDAGKFWRARLNNQLKRVDEHLAQNKWFAGDEITAADVMMIFSLSTGRGFSPYDLGPFPNILRWLKDATDRPAYKRYLEKADDGMAPMIEPVTRRFTHLKSFKGPLESLEL